MNRQEKIKKILRRVFSPVFLVFFLLAFILWYISSLSQNYTTTIDVDVLFDVNYDATIIVETPSVSVELLAEGDGRVLLPYKMGFGSAVTLPLSDLILMKEGQNYMYGIDEESLLRAMSQHQSQFKVLMITDTIAKVKISPTVELKLPVVPRLEVDCVPQYTVNGELHLSPDSVMVKAPQSMLDTLKCIYTETEAFSAVRTDLSGVIRLEVPSGAYVSNNMVRYTASVVGYYQETVTLPIQQGVGQNMLLLPSEATLTLKLPREVKNINLSNIKISVGKQSESLDGLMRRVVVSGLPAEVIEWSVEPEFIEIYNMR
ncbi:MAG: hypothetical protein R3Y49_05960 [Rikenellaceae bacterium]